MPKQIYSIALCRVSTSEQRLNNSLPRQERNVLIASEQLNAPIIKFWSGSVSSKSGTNVDRKDLKEMEEFCKKNKDVKYLIVDEPDRFMRSISEGFYFEVLFKQLGVKVWFASDPMLNTDDLHAKMLKFSKYFPAESSNVERIQKSINGQVDALRQGRYPFSPKPGYRKGKESGVQEIDEIKGPILRGVLLSIARHVTTPTTALRTFNHSEFMSGRSVYKMDKFRKIITDPFYAGILHIDKQVKYHNENGLHQPLITRQQHFEIVDLMNNKKKKQSGPRKGGNPKYPLNNLVSCDKCINANNGRIVGFDHGNGKNNSRVWEKYRCRSCGIYVKREDLHIMLSEILDRYAYDSASSERLIKALAAVWKKNEGLRERDIERIERSIASLQQAISQQIEAITLPSNEPIRHELFDAISKKKNSISVSKNELASLSASADSDKQEFLSFAVNFIQDFGSIFLNTTPENRVRCKQLLFPAGLRLNANKKLYTPQISPIITLMASKKDAVASNNSLMVHQVGESFHLIRDEVDRWRAILDQPYQEHLVTR